MMPPPVLCMRKLPGALVMEPPGSTALMRMGVASSRSLGTATTGTAQSPKSWQSLCGATAVKRGMGAVTEAVVTVETGAKAMVSWATVGGVKRGRGMKVGNFTDRSERDGTGTLGRGDGGSAGAGSIGDRDANQHQGAPAGHVLADGLR